MLTAVSRRESPPRLKPRGTFGVEMPTKGNLSWR